MVEGGGWKEGGMVERGGVKEGKGVEVRREGGGGRERGWREGREGGEEGGEGVERGQSSSTKLLIT